MRARCTLIWFLLTSAAHAESWSGVALDALSDAGVEHLTQHTERDLWRGALADGALIRLEILPTVEEAERAFSFQSVALTSRVAEPGPGVADASVGSGTDYLLIRDQNALISVRDEKGQDALAHVQRLRSLLVAQPDVPDVAPPAVAEAAAR